MMLRTVAKRFTSRSLWTALREVGQEWRIQTMHRASSEKARTLASRGEPLRLNLASGHHPKPGWVNIDLFAPTADLRLDLREPLPFPDESVAYIYAEHFFEHLNYAEVSDSAGWDGEGPGRPSEAMAFLRECRRVLVRGGILDIVVPDAEGILQEYVNRHTDGFPKYEWWGPKWCDTPMHCVNYVFRQGREHKYAYDEQTLKRVMESAGFSAVARRQFEAGRDLPNHEIGSLCMVGTKSAG